MLIALLIAYASRSATAQQPTPLDQHKQRYANAGREFDKTLFYKPAPTQGLLSIELAPLIVVEVASKQTGEALANPFGALVLNASGELNIELTKPTVYFDETRVVMHGREYAERVFAIYARPPDHGINAGQLTSVHLVLDADGFPLAGLVWNRWFQERRRRCGYAVFVSEPLEQQARNRFGAPSPGCRYSIERGPRNDCSPTVPSVFAAGPIPMGPYIYFGAQGNVTTLLCRCSPSQMKDVLETRDYRLEPIERALAARDKLKGPQRENCPVPPDAERTARLIEQALRWPLEPSTDAKPNEDR